MHSTVCLTGAISPLNCWHAGLNLCHQWCDMSGYALWFINQFPFEVLLCILVLSKLEVCPSVVVLFASVLLWCFTWTSFCRWLTFVCQMMDFCVCCVLLLLFPPPLSLSVLCFVAAVTPPPLFHLFCFCSVAIVDMILLKSDTEQDKLCVVTKLKWLMNLFGICINSQHVEKLWLLCWGKWLDLLYYFCHSAGCSRCQC